MGNLLNPTTLSYLSEIGRPTSISDFAALAAVGVGSAAYLLRGIAWDKPDAYHHIWFERPQFKDGVTAHRPQATRNIAEKLEQLGKNVVIFWGSQSGTGEAIALRLARECHLRFGLEVLAADLSDYDFETVSLIPHTKLAIFILSTFGEGDPSDNAAGLWDCIHKNASSLQLKNLSYAALGLGNSNYKYYNRVVEVVAEQLDNAGANRILPIGRADDCSGGTEEDFLAWKEDLFHALTSKLGYHEREVPYTPTLAIVKDTSIPLSEAHRGIPFDKVDGNRKKTGKTSPIKTLSISHVYKLYNSPQRNCIHLEMDLGDHHELRYKTGDHLMVYPPNSDEEVCILLRALGLENDSSTPLRISSIEEGVAARLPSPTTAEALFRYYLEVCALVSRDTVRELAKFAPTQEAKTLLMSLGKDKASYASFVRRNHVTIGRLLAISAPGSVWTDLPLSYLLETITPLQPRYYSISSSSVVSARRLAITVGIEKTPIAEEPTIEIHGLTSNYLLALAQSFEPSGLSLPELENQPKYALSGPDMALQGHKVFAAIRRSKFKLPALGSTPLIMVAAGTGLAPFRAFIQERARLKSVGQPVGRMLLFFGCRHPDEDFLYKQELTESATTLEGSLEIVTAFSRVNDKPKMYVQNQMKTKANEICELLDQGAGLYICGRAAMAREVGNEIQEIMMTQYRWDQVRLSEWSEGMKRGNKWLEDVWG